MRRLTLLTCDESWEDMPGDDVVRSCDRCGHAVHDLTARSEEEVETFLERHASSRTCVRYAAALVTVAIATGCAGAPPVEHAPPPKEDVFCERTVERPPGLPAPQEKIDPKKDSDGDGVPDVDDACPFEPGIVTNDNHNGCPKTFVGIIVKDVQILELVSFAQASSKIRPESLPIVDEVANVLKAMPEILEVEIVGHASSDERNPVKLGEARAKAVFDALLKRGIEAARLKVKSAGDTLPIADNKTQEGREKNRRVSFTITNQKR